MTLLLELNICAMGRGKTLSEEEKGKILALTGEHLSNRNIARKIGRDPWVVNNFLKNPQNYGQNRKGRTAKATTERERRAILREASNSANTVRKIKEAVGTSASVRTVQRVIKQSPNLRRKKLQKKPHLLQRHRSVRLEFARLHVTWQDEWRNVIFSVEKKFNLDGPDGFQYYFHDLRKEERFLSRRHSAVGSVMVWASISYRGAIDIVVLEGRQNSTHYVELLETQIINFEEMFEGQRWVFQHDNAPIHTARHVKQWFSAKNVTVLDWPALSPDLNIIENVWGWLSREVYAGGTQFHNKTDLSKAIYAAFETIPLQYIQKLYDSINNRLFEVIRGNGGPTKY